MNFRKVNNITGWAIGIIACTTYFLTKEATGSFWDCGEFVSCAYKMEIPHPPGSPLFSMLGRLFIILFSGGNPDNAATAVNLMSAMASGFTILFLFWTITHFARNMFANASENLSGAQLFTVMTAGVVGSLAYCFSDSFWYSAVEGEVYALSSFFTAVLFWAMLKWYHADELAKDVAEKRRADRWIVFFFFMMGLAITVHLLNILTIPAAVMLYYFRRYNVTRNGGIIALLTSFALAGMVLWVFIYLIPRWSAGFDRIFVNNFNLPVFSGFAFFFVLLAVLTWFLLKWASKKGKTLLRLGLWCFIFMMVGYSSYISTLVRSNANPAIDMSNVDNPMSLASYFGREQYGSAPLLYGPHFAANIPQDINQDDPYEYGRMKYQFSGGKYVAIGREQDYNYKSEVKMFFPRVWDRSNDQGHADFYASWLGLKETDPRTGQTTAINPPSYGDNMNFFMTYQMGLMYWRYFMWNFAGRQNDLQGFGNARDGNWISGISFIDNAMLGDQSKMPESSTNSKAHNTLFLLPFLLGIIGCAFQLVKFRKEWFVTFLLFFMTGIAIGIYLNMPGNQPRERDYAFVGSFYAFAIWIGLAVPALIQLIQEKTNNFFKQTLIVGGILTFVVTLMSGAWHTSGMLVAALMILGLFAGLTALVVYAGKAISGQGEKMQVANALIGLVCIITPIIMAQQEWDDHTRSKKHLASDIAHDYLESCAPNAILITFGDNDTYPLWYAQEVEGVRPDIRIINSSLLGIDWYINQLRYKVNQSDPIDVIWTPAQILGHNREYIQYQENKNVDPNKYFPLYDFMKNYLGKETIDQETGLDAGPQSFPVKRFSVPVDTVLVRKNGTVNPNDVVVPSMNFELPASGGRLALVRNDLIVLNIIAANNWKRPIYFTSPYGSLGFGDYLRKDGLTYRLVPAQMNNPSKDWVVRLMPKANNTDTLDKNVMTKFVYTSKRGVYFDEENRRHALSIRNTFAEAAGNTADLGKKEEALKILEKADNLIPEEDLPYAMMSRDNSHDINGMFYLEALYKAGNFAKAEKVKAVVKKSLEQQQAYYKALQNSREDLFAGFAGPDGDAARNDYFLNFLLGELEKKYDPKKQTAQPKPEQPGNGPIISDPAKAADTQKRKL